MTTRFPVDRHSMVPGPLDDTCQAENTSRPLDNDDPNELEDEPLCQLFFSVKSELLRNIRDNLALKLEIRALKEKFIELLRVCEKSDDFREAMNSAPTVNLALESIHEEDGIGSHALTNGRDARYGKQTDANSNHKQQSRSLERKSRTQSKQREAAYTPSRYRGTTSGYESSSSSIRSCQEVSTLSTENISPRGDARCLECYDLDKEYDGSPRRHEPKVKHKQYGHYNTTSDPPEVPPRNPKLLQKHRSKEDKPPPLPPRNFRNTAQPISREDKVKNGVRRVNVHESRTTSVCQYNGHDSSDASQYGHRQRQHSASSRTSSDIHENIRESSDCYRNARCSRKTSCDSAPPQALNRHHELRSSTDSVRSFTSNSVEMPPPLPPRSHAVRSSTGSTQSKTSVSSKQSVEEDGPAPPLPPRTHFTRSSTDSMSSRQGGQSNKYSLGTKLTHFQPRQHVLRSSTDSVRSQPSMPDTDSTFQANKHLQKYNGVPKRPDKPASLSQKKTTAKSNNATSNKLPASAIKSSQSEETKPKRRNGYKVDPKHSKVPADFDDSLSETSDIYAWNIKDGYTKSESSMFDDEENLKLIYQMTHEMDQEESSVDMESMDDPTSCSQFFQEQHPKHRRCPDHDLHVALGEPCSYYLEDTVPSSIGSSAWYEEGSLSSELPSSSASSESLNSMGSIEDSQVSENATVRPSTVRRCSLPSSVVSAQTDNRSQASSLHSYSRTNDTRSQTSTYSYHTDNKSVASTVHSDIEEDDGDEPYENAQVPAPTLPDEDPINGEESPTSSMAVTGSSVSDLNSVSTPNGSQTTSHDANESEAPSPAFPLPLINLHDGLPRMKMKYNYSPSLSSSEAQGMVAPINSPQMTDSGGSRMSFATRSDSGSRWSYAGSRLSFSTMTDSGGSRLSYAGSRFSYLSNVTDFSAGSRYSYAVSTCTEQPDDYVELSKTEPVQTGQTTNKNKRLPLLTSPHMLPGEFTPTHIPAHVLMEGFRKAYTSSESGSDKKTNSNSTPANGGPLLNAFPARSSHSVATKSTTDTTSVSGSVTGTDTNSVIPNEILSPELLREKKKSLRKKIKHFTNSFYRVNKSTGTMDIKTLAMV